jgi:PPOX class probable F420-dependent enzyme
MSLIRPVWQASDMPQMTRDEAFAFLAHGTRTGKLATARGDRPHVAPVWFVVDADDLVFTTGEDTVKGRHLRANPQAALSVDVDIYPYSFAVVRGPVWWQSGAPDLLEWSTRIAARYVPVEQADAYGRRNAVPSELLCRLRVEHVTGFVDIAL